MLQGKIILQDRPAVLEKAITGPEVERMSYDYLTEQPVKGFLALTCDCLISTKLTII